jgi:nucleotide-binding universal stress UspA family protein
VVLGQIDPEDPVAQMAKGSVEQVLLSSGRPVLLIPKAGCFETIGETVLIGWKASREAARAVNDAIPVLEKSNSVTVLAVNPEHGICGGGDLPAADIARHLARHGISVNAAQRTAEPRAECDALLDYAADLRADLLVIGGYGHLTQSIMGGVTRALLERARVPLLLSH